MELLKKLALCTSPSGREDGIREIIKEEVKECFDEIYTDALGNLICHKKGNGKKLMLCAHMDEIGFVVTYIDNAGFLRFGNVGGILAYNSINSRVVFENGTVGTISYENKENPSNINLSKMYIDIGATSREDAEKRVKIGDMAVYQSQFYENGNRVISKALDDRAGCAILIEAVKKAEKNANDLFVVFTSQEEVGLRGAKVASNSVEPDMAVSVDVSNVGDTPASLELNLKLGEGPAVKMKDSSYIIHPSARRYMLDCAKNANIKFQLEASSYGGTDTGAIHLSGSGVPAGTISIPTRYIHSANEVIDIADYKASVELIKTVIETSVEEYLQA